MQKWDVIGHRGWGLTSVLAVQSLLKKIGFAPWPDIILSQTLYSEIRNLLDSDVRQCSHSLIISLHYLQAKSNNRTCDQFECDVNWFCFCFDFVRSLARCGCCSIVYWRVCGCVGAGGREGGLVRLKLDVQGQGGGEILDVDGQGGSWKLDNFHGRQMCIVPYYKNFQMLKW